MAQTDAFKELFLQASSDGDFLTGEDEWKDFFQSFLTSGLCNSNDDYRLVETIWLESCAQSRAFGSGDNSAPTLSFESLQGRILELHPVHHNNEALSAASAIKLQAANLTSLLNNWDPSKLNEGKTRQLLSVLYALEKDHLLQEQRCAKLSKDVAGKMERTRVKALTTTNGNSGVSAAPSSHADSALVNPLMHFKQNVVLIEKAAAKHRVRSVRYHGSSSEKKGRVAKDTFAFGQTYTDTNRIRAYKGQGSYKGKLVDVMTLVVPKTKISPAAITAAWNGYSAHKSLALAPTCVPHAMGFEDDGEELHFHYEHIPARSLTRILHDVRQKKFSFKLDEYSPLYRHWARETLTSMFLLHEQCPHVLLNAFDMGGENCMVARQGTSMRLGRLLWGPLFDPTAGAKRVSPKTFFRERECSLLRGFGRALRTMLSSEREEESVKKFVPEGLIEFDVGAALEAEGGGVEFDAKQPLVFPTSVQVGQRLVINLPPTSCVPHVQYDTGALGSSVLWHKPVVGRVGASDSNNSNVPMQVVNENAVKRTLDSDVKGNAQCVLYASKVGLCDIQIPFFDPALKTIPSVNCTVTIACEVVPPSCSSQLTAIMGACLGAQEEKENFTTLKSLLNHKYFEALSVRELEDVMSMYEADFAPSSGGGGGGGVSVL
ncbi:hypothetical protein TrLO_g9232 [Triparma laevis f. longispina]|uniref:Uncharacterized protein n=1 Tax=Triparma laevis f. longispina TaxID=1714387 RepID=A0A9W7F6Y1_9STRA|nr:hypothetical protein TrLO_g9232 [Triparma laevis f. longispina]